MTNKQLQELLKNYDDSALVRFELIDEDMTHYYSPAYGVKFTNGPLGEEVIISGDWNFTETE